jgi:hypothetical protein
LEALDPISDFIDFPPREEILRRLRAVDDSSQHLESLYAEISGRLAGRTYERSASAFILIEILYDHEETHGADMSYLLPRYVLALTEDRDLALSALGAFNEIKDAIRLQQPAPAEPPALPRRAPRAAEAPPRPLPPPAALPPLNELDLMMAKLQIAQKALSDRGLATRISVDLAARRPSPDRVSRTLQDIASVRGALRRFEELLSQAELQVLEAAGVLWEEETTEAGSARQERASRRRRGRRGRPEGD